MKYFNGLILADSMIKMNNVQEDKKNAPMIEEKSENVENMPKSGMTEEIED